MIRPALLKAISAALQSHSYLSQEDFITREFKNPAGRLAIEIKYRYNTTLFSRFVIPTTRTDSEEYIFGSIRVSQRYFGAFRGFS